MDKVIRGSLGWAAMAPRFFVCLAAALLLFGVPARAFGQETPISKATEAWELGRLAPAGKLYEAALAGGGLNPTDTLDAFVRVGAWHAVAGQSALALNALRKAAIIDPDFECPKLAGARAKPLCERARKEAAGRNKLMLSIEAPEGVKHDTDVSVAVTLPESLAPLFEAISLAVEDRPGHVVHAEEKPLSDGSDNAVSGRVEFEVPAAELTAGSTLNLRALVRDAQKNEWARASATLRVSARALPPAPPPEPAPPPPPVAKTGFWHGPWPYVVGGSILASAIVTIAVAASSGGGDAVRLHAPTWQTASFSR